MATYNIWTYPVAQAITGTTKIAEADNKIQAGIDTLEAWVNGTGDYVGTGLEDYITEFSTELQTGVDADLATWLTTFSEDQIDVEW